jgi:hypothetical protein
MASYPLFLPVYLRSRINPGGTPGFLPPPEGGPCGHPLAYHYRSVVALVPKFTPMRHLCSESYGMQKIRANFFQRSLCAILSIRQYIYRKRKLPGDKLEKEVPGTIWDGSR